MSGEVNLVFKQMSDEAKKKRIAKEEYRKNELPLVLTEAQRTKLIEENKSATQEGKDDCKNCTRLQIEAKEAEAKAKAEKEAKTGGMRIRKKRKSSSKKRKTSSKKRKASSKKRKASSKKRKASSKKR